MNAPETSAVTANGTGMISSRPMTAPGASAITATRADLASSHRGDDR